MATAEQTNKQIEAPCTNCGTMFKRRPGGRSTCKASCKKKRQRAAAAPQQTAKENKIERRKARLLESAFGYWFIEQARRAGTVQTYHGIDVAGLHQLYAMHNYRKKRYGWVDSGHGKDVFQQCHVQPLKGRDRSTGLTTPENLFTGIAELNQRQGSKPVNSWAGATLPASARKRKWDVTDDMTRDQVLKRIADYLGQELDTFLDELAKIPQRTARLRLARAVFKHQSNVLYEPLDRRYTLSELGALELEELQALDAIQRGSTTIKAFTASSCPPDSQLGVLHDELLRFSDLLPDGQHKDNCRFTLSLVRVLGSYLAQINDAQGKARGRFLDFPNATWTPLQYFCPQNPWKPSARIVDPDRQMLITSITEAAQNALQGLTIPVEMLGARLVKRLHLQALVPVVRVPDEYSWEACGSDWLNYIDNLFNSFQDTWQALLDLGICTEEQVFAAQDGVLLSLQAAVEQGRERYRNDRMHTVFGVQFQRYPAYLEFPPIAPEERYPVAV
ncbi:hypothetical protein [Pseudomonas fluorescens]|uniref:Uncharacterized protein n=1 Tax=Pseudomonas fluorescens TaxID=294 RepID=A0A5E7H5G4_PSEFL|nr:hypothetical protein [Pseudomonas fluorescens]VVO59078.1 hypothetical protein PS854_00699 [Pseudomonas fluorescens]